MATSSGPALRSARESHGRELSTTPRAAACYRHAQQQWRDTSLIVAALRRALDADPGFVVAAADLTALDQGPPSGGSRALHAWERHHVEVVAAAAKGDVRRAADLLREHLATVRCDPIATAVVLSAVPGWPLRDVLDRLPGCHAAREQ